MAVDARSASGGPFANGPYFPRALSGAQPDACAEAPSASCRATTRHCRSEPSATFRSPQGASARRRLMSQAPERMSPPAVQSPRSPVWGQAWPRSQASAVSQPQDPASLTVPASARRHPRRVRTLRDASAAPPAFRVSQDRPPSRRRPCPLHQECRTDSALGRRGARSAVRFAATFEYAAGQLLCVVISSLKLVISWVTCVRASPADCAAAGSCVSWLSVLRASVRCRLAASASTFGAAGSGVWAGGVAGGCVVAGG